jgi:hypothetical protein
MASIPSSGIDTEFNLNSKGLKVLGTYVGNDKEFFKQNWHGIQDDIAIKLEKWKPFAG